MPQHYFPSSANSPLSPHFSCLAPSLLTLPSSLAFPLVQQLFSTTSRPLQAKPNPLRSQDFPLVSLDVKVPHFYLLAVLFVLSHRSLFAFFWYYFQVDLCVTSCQTLESSHFHIQLKRYDFCTIITQIYGIKCISYDVNGIFA